VPNQVGAVSKEFRHPRAVGLRVVWTAGIGAAPVTRSIRHNELIAFSQALLRRKMAITAKVFIPLRASMDQHNFGAGCSPTCDMDILIDHRLLLNLRLG
jgi:hypothetical protein